MPGFPVNKCFSSDFLICFHSFYDYIHTVPLYAPICICVHVNMFSGFFNTPHHYKKWTMSEDLQPVALGTPSGIRTLDTLIKSQVL